MSELLQVLRKGLVKAARTTGAWIFTGGTNTGESTCRRRKITRLFFNFLSSSRLILLGVTKQVGEALQHEGQQRTGRLVSIGIAPWGIVERNHELLGHNRDIPYVSISSPRFGERPQIEFDGTEKNLSLLFFLFPCHRSTGANLLCSTIVMLTSSLSTMERRGNMVLRSFSGGSWRNLYRIKSCSHVSVPTMMLFFNWVKRALQ